MLVITSRYLQMLLRSPARRWLSPEVQSDLVLVCEDGRVPCHAALLAPASALLHQLLAGPGHAHCAGCPAPRALVLAGVGVAECGALVELLYTGRATYTRDLVAALQELCSVLGLELDRLDIVDHSQNTVTSRVRLHGDSVDSVHRRFNRHSQESLLDCSELTHNGREHEPGPATSTASKLSVITSGLRSMFSSSQPQLTRPHFGQSSASAVRRERLSRDLLAEPLSSFPTKKLPTKTPDISDNILTDDETQPGPGSRLPPHTPVRSAVPRPHSGPLQPASSPGQVMVPNSVLSEVMQMVTVESIKVEAETENSDLESLSECPQMEGREEDDEDTSKSSAVTAYLSMNNSRNYVCEKCDTGFTFIRSYKWHLPRCRGKEAAAPRPANIPSPQKAAMPVVVCKICQASVTGLKSHLSLVHFKTQLLEKFSSSPRKCKICSKSFKSIHSLILHIGIHHGMVKKLSQSSNPILKRKMITKSKQSQSSPSKDLETKEKNSLYRASLLKKKLTSVSPSNHNSLSPQKAGGKSPVSKTDPGKPRPAELSAAVPGPSSSSSGGVGVARKAACGACVKCKLPDCGACPQCAGGGAAGVARVCVKKVCRNKIWTAA